MAIRSNWAALVANALVPVAIVIFASGFFPYKTMLPGLAKFDELNDVTIPPAPFDKVIFMVVDALRSDFVYSNQSGFSFTQSLIRSGAAIPFTSHASSPTVTMPRLKSMTTGSVPSFLDVILNIAESDTSSTLAHQDTWLAQLKAKGGKLLLYGDDTWLKLFPGMFDRADGTTSFFVSDFVEVDSNVTRHVPGELLNSDWSALIMHYLGLDHIGHKAGPRSPHMVTKQHEMDSVVTQIYAAMKQEEHLQSAIFVLCGDHGMNDGGNHGGSSIGETSPALLFISPKFEDKEALRDCPVETPDNLQYYRTVEQSDITPTLAGLLGFPISLNSLGVFIPEFLMMWNHGSQRIRILLENSKQLLKPVKATFPNYNFDPSSIPSHCDLEELDGIKEVECAWSQASELLQSSQETGVENPEIEHALLRFSISAQHVMSSAASNYDVSRLFVGLSVSAVAALLSLLSIYRLLLKSRYPSLFLTLSILGYGSMMFASSYVEEEQQFWYWIFTGWIFYLHVKSSRQYSRRALSSAKSKQNPRQIARLLACEAGTVGLAISHRALRRWNQTGQKFAGESDIARSFLPFHQNILWLMIMLTYVDSCRGLLLTVPRNLVWKVLAALVTLAAFIFKVGFVASDSPELLDKTHILRYMGSVSQIIPPVSQARLVFCGLALLATLSVYLEKSRAPSQDKATGRVFHEALALFVVTQSKATNIPLFLIFRVQFLILASTKLADIEITITSLLLQHMTFFAFGGSNAISSVDLSNAYNGIGSYNVLLVGFLTFVSNWAGPIWWASAARALRSKDTQMERWNHIALLSLFVTTTLLSTMAACTALRTHLFIWTVFSPKFLYTMAWSTANHLLANLLQEVDFSILLRR